MKTLLRTVALAGMLGSGVAIADNGTALLNNCQEAIRALENGSMTHNEMFHSGLCLGMMEGVISMMQFYQTSNVPDDYKACFPNDSMSTAQATRIVVKYLKANPEVLHQDATYLTTLALHKAFPCE